MSKKKLKPVKDDLIKVKPATSTSREIVAINKMQMPSFKGTPILPVSLLTKGIKLEDISEVRSFYLVKSLPENQDPSGPIYKDKYTVFIRRDHKSEFRITIRLEKIPGSVSSEKSKMYFETYAGVLNDNAENMKSFGFMEEPCVMYQCSEDETAVLALIITGELKEISFSQLDRSLTKMFTMLENKTADKINNKEVIN